MTRQKHCPTDAAVFAEQFIQQRASGDVQCGVGFIQEPHCCSREQEPGECQAPLLSLRELPYRLQRRSLQPDPCKGSQQHVIRCRGVMQLAMPAQILQRGQETGIAISMTDEGDGGMSSDVAFTRQQSTERPQQCRLAAAVGATQFDTFTREELEAV
jgi:hypothetical protein